MSFFRLPFTNLIVLLDRHNDCSYFDEQASLQAGYHSVKIYICGNVNTYLYLSFVWKKQKRKYSMEKNQVN